MIGAQTRLLPERYDARLTVGEADFSCYGFDVPFPIHAWPDLDEEGGWLSVPFRGVADPVQVFSVDFRHARAGVEPCGFDVLPWRSVMANAVRLTGVVNLGAGVTLGETPSFNGAKLLPIPPLRLRAGEVARLHWPGRDPASSLATWRCRQSRSEPELPATPESWRPLVSNLGA